ncbi:MAG: hypothetical protein ABFS42_06870 [Candidatus Krumholzibacteriota bacterium]
MTWPRGVSGNWRRVRAMSQADRVRACVLVVTGLAEAGAGRLDGGDCRPLPPREGRPRAARPDPDERESGERRLEVR